MVSSPDKVQGGRFKEPLSERLQSAAWNHGDAIRSQRVWGAEWRKGIFLPLTPTQTCISTCMLWFTVSPAAVIVLIVLDEVQAGKGRGVPLFHHAWDSGDAACQRSFWASEWGNADAHLRFHASPCRFLNTDNCLCSRVFQLKYKASLKKDLSSTLFHLMPETLETAHAKEVSELLSEVTSLQTGCSSMKELMVLLGKHQYSCFFFRWSIKMITKRTWASTCFLFCLRLSTPNMPRKPQTCAARYSQQTISVRSHPYASKCSVLVL